MTSKRPLILVVESDRGTAAAYAARFAVAGWKAAIVDDGRQALALAISGHPAAIVTEAMAPMLDGFALCQILRSDVETQEIPIVVVTANEDQRAQAMDAGATQVLVKPCQPDTLTRAVEAVLRGRGEPPSSRPTMSGTNSEAASLANDRSPLQRHGATTSPPPLLLCPQCGKLLAYRQSYIGGVRAVRTEQWDDYQCSSGCGQFEYRHRTRKLQRKS